MVFLVAILLFVFSKAISSMYKTSDISFLLKIGAVYLIFTSLYTMFGAIFLAYQKVRYATFMDTVFQVSRVLVVGAFLLAYKDISLVFVGLTLAAIFTFVSGLVISIIKYPFLFKGEIQKVERKRMLNFSGFILLGSLGIMIFANIDKLILGYFVQPEFLGYYTVILTLLK